MLTGVNHVAVVTADLDRFVAFYSGVFDVPVVFHETDPPLRHAILRTGPASWLHPAEVADNPHGNASDAMFRRGHIDHLALGAVDEASFEAARARLVERGATDGTVDDMGPFRSVWFTDPDGMRAELVVIVDPALAGIHEPRPLP